MPRILVHAFRGTLRWARENVTVEVLVMLYTAIASGIRQGGARNWLDILANSVLDGLLAVLFVVLAVFVAQLLRAPKEIRAMKPEPVTLLTIKVDTGTVDRLQDAAFAFLKQLRRYEEWRKNALGRGPENDAHVDRELQSLLQKLQIFQHIAENGSLDKASWSRRRRARKLVSQLPPFDHSTDMNSVRAKFEKFTAT